MGDLLDLPVQKLDLRVAKGYFADELSGFWLMCAWALLQCCANEFPQIGVLHLLHSLHDARRSVLGRDSRRQTQT